TLRSAMNIVILGAGAWGTALAIVFAQQHTVTLWTRSDGQREHLRRERRSLYLPEATLPDAIVVTEDLPGAVAKADLVLIATPTAGLRESLDLIKASRADVPVIWACKGFETDSGLLPHQVVAEVLGDNALCGALSGPSFAAEVARAQPTALTLAARDENFARETAAALHQPRLRVYFSDDLSGVEVGGAVKNVMAIATGISD